MCMKRLAIVTKGCGQLTSNYTSFADIWFSSVKTAEEVMASRVNYFGILKTRHKGFFLATIEIMMKYWPGGSYLVMKSTPRVYGGIPLMAIGYKYNFRNVLGSISTEGGGITEPGDPYLSSFPDIYSYISVCLVVCPL